MAQGGNVIGGSVSVCWYPWMNFRHRRIVEEAVEAVVRRLVFLFDWYHGSIASEGVEVGY